MRKKIIILTFLAVMVLTVFSGCSGKNFQMKQKNPEIDAFVEDLMASKTSGEHESFIIKYFGEQNLDEFSDVMEYFSEYVQGDMTQYRYVSYETTARQSGDAPAIVQTVYIYIVDTDQSSYMLTITTTKQDGDESIIGFYIYRGGIENLTGSTIGNSPWQTVLLVYSIICCGFIIAAIVVCAKSKVRRKALWIIGLLIQNGFSFSHIISGGQFKISFMFLFLKIGLSSLTLYPNGSYKLLIVFPVIALIFLASKNKLEKKALAYREKKAAKAKGELAPEDINEPYILK